MHADYFCCFFTRWTFSFSGVITTTLNIKWVPYVHNAQQFYVDSSASLRISYTMGCLPVRGDNPRALASGLSYVQEDKHGITILYHLHQCRPSTS